MLNLRELTLQKAELRKQMNGLWEKRADRDWTAEEKKSYDDLSARATKLSEDLKLRAEFERDFKETRSKEDQDFERSSREANISRIIRREVYRKTGDSAFRDDYGRTEEVLAEHRRSVNETHIKAGFTSIPDSSLKIEKRTTLTSNSSLTETDVRDELYAEGLYEKTWAAEAGVPMLSGLEGDQVVPKLNTKPAFGWVAEDGAFPDQDIDFSNIKLTPKYAGAIQILSLGAQIRSKADTAMRFVQQELMNQFRSGLDNSFLNGLGANDPKGLRSIIQSYNSASNVLEPADEESNLKTLKADWTDLLQAEGLITDTNDQGELVWLISGKLKRAAQKVLKFSVNGAQQLFQGGMLGDTKALVTNSVPVDLEIADGATGYSADIDDAGEISPTQLMTALLIQPQSLVIGRWLGGLQIQVSTEGKFFEKGQIAVRLIDACNMVSRRESSLAELKNILDFKGV